MISHVCTKCHIEKPDVEFYKRTSGKRLTNCKACQKQYREANKERDAMARKIRYEANREEILTKGRAYEARPEVQARRKAQKAVYHQTPEHKARIKVWRQIPENKAKKNVQVNKWRRKNKGLKPYLDYRYAKRAEYFAAHAREKRATDPHFKMAQNLRRRIRKALENNWKAASTAELTGCSMEHLRKHLESQFRDGMTWDHFLRGEIHIDHKIPCCAFDLSREDHQRHCFNWKNLQPLWELENLQKIEQDRKMSGSLVDQSFPTPKPV